MSDLICEVTTITELTKHPNADSLSLTKVYDFPVVVRTEDWKVGDRAVYFPVDCVVPEHPALEFLYTRSDGTVDPSYSRRRLRAKKLRGLFSMGLLVPLRLFAYKLRPNLPDGANVASLLGVEKYEPRVSGTYGSKNPRRIPLNKWQEFKKKYFPRWLKRFFPVKHLTEPAWFVKYTDIQNIRKYSGVFVEGEPLVLTEKVHGSNGRFCYENGRLWIGSRNMLRAPGDADVWNEVAKHYDLESRLKTCCPGVIVFGEVFGKTQVGDGYGYGVGNECCFVMFDAFDTASGMYYDYPKMRKLANSLGLGTAPELGRITWTGLESLRPYAEGQTTVFDGKGNHVREGFVIRPLEERFDGRVGRVILKLHGEGYLLGKKG